MKGYYKDIIQFINDNDALDKIFKSQTGRNIDVAVIDSGIDETHPFLKGSVIRTAYFTSNADDEVRYKEIPPGMNDANGHGTACAGIIKTIAKDVRLFDVKVLGETCGSKFNVFIEGFKYALDNNVKVINMSLGTVIQKYIMPLFKLMQQAYKNNVIVVAAEDNRKREMYPAYFPSAITVDIGRVNAHQKLVKRKYSMVDFGGWGEYVKTCGLNRDYTEMFGTSFAAPHVTGIIALLLEKWPELSVDDVKFLLSYYSTDFE